MRGACRRRISVRERRVTASPWRLFIQSACHRATTAAARWSVCSPTAWTQANIPTSKDCEACRSRPTSSSAATVRCCNLCPAMTAPGMRVCRAGQAAKTATTTRSGSSLRVWRRRRLRLPSTSRCRVCCVLRRGATPLLPSSGMNTLRLAARPIQVPAFAGAGWPVSWAHAPPSRRLVWLTISGSPGHDASGSGLPPGETPDIVFEW